MKFNIYSLLSLAAVPLAFATPLDYGSYGNYPVPAGGYGSYDNAPVPTPVPTPVGGYDDYPAPAGGYDNYPVPAGGYGSYKK